MMYTCGYWKEGTRTLEEAQRNKNEHICRKLRLVSEDRVADIGCGWGGFMFHAWQHHGTAVTGFNTTTEQVEMVSNEIEQRGLSQKLTVLERDFREVEGRFDKVAHIGVLEHAGRDQLEDAISALAECVETGGLGVLHFIGHVGRYDTEYFIRKHIFPGGWIPSLSETLELMEQYGLEILDVENLRRHYALTLDAWAERFDRYWEQIHGLDSARFDEGFRRKWRVYLLGCAELFRSPRGYTHLFQITFSKGNVSNEYPMSRTHLYADPASKRQPELAL
jgi:cyclopropane-fatty-acyl-phospholipid synthase